MQRVIFRLGGFSLIASVLAGVAVLNAQKVGPNVNMVAGLSLPNGDPFLQRQNEPSGAVSTRNPLHLLAGANDYRTVDYPGLPDHLNTGDAWLGVFKSVDGGQVWDSTLVPGFPQDATAEGQASPLKGYEAGADPVVRAGTNGLFYYSGIVFNRAPGSPSAVFVARYIDNNNAPGTGAMVYLDAKLVAKGKRGFTDKPYMVVDIPRAPGQTCTINAPGAAPQTIPAGPVYVAYMLFDAATTTSKLMVVRSLDCGVTWSNPSLASEQKQIHQGVTMAIDPATGTLHLAWRQFRAPKADDSIWHTRSLSIPPPKQGNSAPLLFAKPAPVASIKPFDQANTPTTFRTNSYPTMALDGSGRIYLAWAERGWGPVSTTEPPWTIPNPPAPGDARVVMTVGKLSDTGDRATVSWSARQPIENAPVAGHQVMPVLSAVAGRLTLLFYDLREDVAGVFESFVDDSNIVRKTPSKRHTINIRVGQALYGDVPAFAPSVAVSSYKQGSRPGSITLEQLQFNVPNLPLYAQGSLPFVGDYLDLGGEAFVIDATGNWVYNTSAGGPAVQYAFWTDNRDVRPPRDGNWANYTPPLSALNSTCSVGQTGMRNANIYSARLSPGLRVGSPDNSKRLGSIEKSFVVFAQNNTDQYRRFRFIIANQPVGGEASFLQFSPPGSPLTSMDVTVAPRSMASRTVYATSTDPTARIVVDVVEVDIPPTPTPFPPVTAGGLEGTIVLNPDVTNPDVTNPDVTNFEVFNPVVSNPDVTNPDVTNPDVTNPDVTNVDLSNISLANPDVTNPTTSNPDVTNPSVKNPDVTNPDVTNPDVTNGALIDVTWRVTNTGNSAGSFAVKTFLSRQAPPGFKTQLILHKAYATPIAAPDCTLKTETQTVLIANIINPDVTNPEVTNPDVTNPDVTNPDVTNPDVTNPDVTNATLWLEPGDTARITLRVLMPDKTQLVAKTVTQSTGVQQTVFVDPAFDPSVVVTPVVISQSVNTADALLGITTPAAAVPASQAIVPAQVSTMVTDASVPPPSSQLRVPSAAGVSLTGDLLLADGRGASVLRRPPGSPAFSRVFQAGDPIPGVPGSRVGLLSNPSGNLAGQLAFSVDAQVTTGSIGAVLVFDGSTVQRVAVTGDVAPGTGGQTFSRVFVVRGISDAGTVVFTNIISGGTTHIFAATLGGPVVRLVGPGDPSPPGFSSTFTNVGALGVVVAGNGDVLFSSTFAIAPGTGLTMWTSSGLRKVLVTGEPLPVGGSAPPLVVMGLLNNTGRAVFTLNGHIYESTVAGGFTVLTTAGSALPAAPGGTLSGNPTIIDYNDAGEVAFAQPIAGAGTANLGLFRFRPSNPLDVVAYRTQPIPGVPGRTFQNFSLISMNASGVIGFRGDSATNVGEGIFTQTSGSPLAVIVRDGDPTPLGGSYLFPPAVSRLTVWNDGTVHFNASVADGSATDADFLWSSGTVTTLFSTADVLPASSRVLLAERGFAGPRSRGDYVGMNVERPGGRLSLIGHNLATSSSFVAITDGDVVPATGGRLRISSSNPYINASGLMLHMGLLVGGTRSDQTAIVVAGPTGGIQVIAITFDTDSVGRVLTAFSLPGVAGPSPINDSGQVVFSATVPGTGTGLFVGSAGNAPVKVALVGDLTSTAATISSMGTLAGFNNGGQVLFSATSGGLLTWFIGTPGGVAQKIVAVGDLAPGGGTFAAFGRPVMNASGEIAFMATTTGGPGGGIYFASATTAPVALALNGLPAPRGGNFAMSVARPDAIITDQHDVMFMSDLTGGTSNSGYFVWRSGVGPLQAIVLEGDPAPGTTGFFSQFAHSLNNAPGEFFGLSSTGGAHFLGGVLQSGVWHARANGQMELVILRGQVRPEAGGGVAVLSSGQFSEWAGGARLPFFAAFTGGPIDNAILLFSAASGAATSTGTNVVVTPADASSQTTPVTLTFSNVQVAGTTTLNTSASGPALPLNFVQGAPAIFYNLTTSALVSGPITVCVDFGATVFPPGTLALVHHNGTTWQNVTTSGPTGTIVCGNVPMLGTFTVVRVSPGPPPLPLLADAGEPVAGIGGERIGRAFGTKPEERFVMLPGGRERANVLVRPATPIM